MRQEHLRNLEATRLIFNALSVGYNYRLYDKIEIRKIHYHS